MIMNNVKEIRIRLSPLKIGTLLIVALIILSVSLTWSFSSRATQEAEAAPPALDILQASGRLDFLRVHDSGGYGPNNDRLEGHIVFSFAGDNRAFGFALGTGSDQNNHKAMFDLLLQAYLNDLVVTTDYEDDGGNNNRAFRVWLSK
jgi:hypothetical protein